MSTRFRIVGLGTLAISILLAACATPAPRLVDDVALRSPPASAEQPAPPAAGNVVIAALNYLDRPYHAGGEDEETGFDCSGFTRHVFGQALGIELPRSALEQAQTPLLQPVARDALRAGDLVFFNTQRRAHSHVGIYVGGGRFIHAPRTGAHIRTESMAAKYWWQHYDGARRALVLSEAANR
ncbi:MAG TPA: C40 family peptidase [Burkholderiaceae bacterium]|nr:C40 family peptidase [Burkholderiaceae bacterium]